MIDVSNMDKVLRSVYLDVVSASLNEKTSAFYKKVAKTGTNVYGKDVVSPTRFGINGGVACTSETGDVPGSSEPTLVNLKAPLVNIYGNVEITDKLLRVSDTGTGSAVDVLNYEIESLLDAAKFNLRRMLFQNGKGILTTTSAAGAGSTTIGVTDTRNLIEGMVVDFLDGETVVSSGHRINFVDRSEKTIKVDKSVPTTVPSGANVTVKGSYNCEMYGIPYLFDPTCTLYGNTRSINKYALPSYYTTNAVSYDKLMEVVDGMEETGAAAPNMIIGGYAMRRRYISSMNTAHLNVEIVEQDGFKAPGFNGIPIYAEPFAGDNVMYFLNTDDFVLAQLADWSWVEGTTHEILHPIQGKAAYSATLVKYCNLLCRKPKHQAQLTYSA